LLLWWRVALAMTVSGSLVQVNGRQRSF
jgi:hypothetical protein